MIIRWISRIFKIKGPKCRKGCYFPLQQFSYFVQSLQAFSNVDYDEIITRYANTFSQLSGVLTIYILLSIQYIQKEYNVNVVRKIVDFKTFLKKAQGQMDGLKKIARSMTKAKNRFYSEFGILPLFSICLSLRKLKQTSHHGI